jgi:hypothetical protein
VFSYYVTSLLALLHIFGARLSVFFCMLAVTNTLFCSIIRQHGFYAKFWKSIFVVAALLIKAKQQHGINQNKNTGFFITCMDFDVVRTKKTKNKIVIFFVCLGLDLNIQKIILQKRKKTKRYFSRNETKRNEYFLEPKPNTETK